MPDSKLIGLALAVTSSLAIGSSYIITKKGLNDAAARSSAYGATATDSLAYLKNPIWWAGMICLVMGEAANFAAYTFAPAILVTPLGALSVIVGAILASIILGEQLGHLGRIGCTLCLIGSLIIVLHAPEEKEVQTVDEILHYAIQPGFLMYCFTCLVVCLVMIYVVPLRYARSNPLVYITVCSLAGSVSVMAVKGFGVAIKLTLSPTGTNQFTHPSTYVFGIVTVSCIMIQMNYFNKALDLFSTNVVNPSYYVLFSSSVLVASLILFQGFNTTDAINTVSLLTGFVVTFIGVHILNLSRTTDETGGALDASHSALEGGLMNPRLSLQGRMSVDGWNGVEPNTPLSARHGRTNSRTLFSAFDENGHQNGDVVGLHQLREEDEVDLDEDSDEADDSPTEAQTLLRSAATRPKSGSRSQSRSPTGNGSPVGGHRSPGIAS